jgi:GNAT superfamily N-acetyltransferase
MASHPRPPPNAGVEHLSAQPSLQIVLDQADTTLITAPTSWNMSKISGRSFKTGQTLPNNGWISMLRRLGFGDSDLAARIHRLSFDQALPTLAGLHTADEDRWFYREHMFPTCQLWGAFDATEMPGVIAFRDGWIDQLYVLPSAQRRSVGSKLLQVAQRDFDQLLVWTFQRNILARRSYEARGFILAHGRPSGRATSRTCWANSWASGLSGEGNCWRPQRGKGARRAVPLGAPRASVSPQEMPCLEATRKAGTCPQHGPSLAWLQLATQGTPPNVARLFSNRAKP